MESRSSDFTADWEYLLNSPDSSNSLHNPPDSHPAEDNEEDYSDGIIRADYFSVDSKTRHATRTFVNAPASSEEGGSVESDNPSWIDPVLHDNLGYRKETTEFWSDSGSDGRSDDRRIELGFVGNEDSHVDFEGVGEIRNFGVRNELGFVGNDDSHVGFEGVGMIGESGEIGNEDLVNEFDAIGDSKSESREFEFGRFSEREESGFVDTNFREIDKKGSVEGRDVKSHAVSGELDAKGNSSVEDCCEKENGVTNGGVKPVGEVEKRIGEWWKGPVEFLRYFVFKVSPVWSFSIAAALVGAVILGRKLYRMKRKSRGLEIKVTVDDKKVSQFMSRAARLNEAFSVVRRVPIIRPVLPGPSMGSWPVISLR